MPEGPVTILVVDDEESIRRSLDFLLRTAGFGVEKWPDGESFLKGAEPSVPGCVLLDVRMPGMDGLQVLEEAKKRDPRAAVVIMTAFATVDTAVTAMKLGAWDYLVKPFDPEELRARLVVATRVVELRRKLAERVHELEAAISRVKQLQGLLPICAYCKKIRDDRNYWQQVEEYVSAHTDAQFSHGICPECYERVLTPQIRALREARGGQPRTP